MSLSFLREAYQAFCEDRISLNELSNHLGLKPAAALALEQRVIAQVRRRAVGMVGPAGPATRPAPRP